MVWYFLAGVGCGLFLAAIYYTILIDSFFEVDRQGGHHDEHEEHYHDR